MPSDDRESSPALSLAALFYEEIEVIPEPIGVRSALIIPSGISSPPRRQVFRCKVCDRNHPLRFCPQFLKASLERRLRWVVKYRYCVRCLAQSHQTTECTSSSRCSHCRDAHHTLLHDGPVSRAVRRNLRNQRHPPISSNSATNLSNPAQINIPTIEVGVLLPTCVIGIICGARSMPIRALLDPTAESSRIHASLVAQLGIPTTRLGARQFCQVQLCSTHNSAIRLSIKAELASEMSFMTPSHDLPETLASRMPNTILADPAFFRWSVIRFILGAPHHDCRQQSCAPGGFIMPKVPSLVGSSWDRVHCIKFPLWFFCLQYDTARRAAMFM